MKKVLIIILILIIIIILWGFFITPNSIVLKETPIKVDNLVSSFDGFKIAQISDILIGSTMDVDDFKKIIPQVNDTKPDIIVFTGDLISDNYKLSDEEIKSLKESFNALECTLSKYAVVGDNDNKQIEIFQDIMKSSGFTILDNESKYQFYKDNKPIKITGISNTDDINKALEIADNLETTLNLVLTHYPDYSEELSNYDVGIILAGHSLKGQIRIPFIGGLMKKENASKYLDSKYTINNTQVFVSGGLGTEKVAFRLFNKPEINLYRLTQK